MPPMHRNACLTSKIPRRSAVGAEAFVNNQSVTIFQKTVFWDLVDDFAASQCRRGKTMNKTKPASGPITAFRG